MGVLVMLAGAVAVLWPQGFSWIDTKTINPLLGVIMFGMGLTLKPQDLKVVAQRPKDIAVGCLAQFIIMPGTAWLLTQAFGLPKELALGVILGPMIEENLGKCFDLAMAADGGLFEVMTSGSVNKVLIAALLLSLSTPFLLMYKNHKNNREAANA